MQEGTPLSMSQVQISTAAFADIEDILAIQRASPQAAQWARSIYMDIFSASEDKGNPVRRTVLCARQQQQTIGFAVISFLNVGGSTECELENLAVSADQRRSGVGTMLLQAVIEHCLQSRAISLNAEVRASNTAALRLYQKNKFVFLSTRKAYYKQPEEDAIVLQWTSDKSPHRFCTALDPHDPIKK